MKKLCLCLMVLAITIILVTQAIAEEPTPGYNNKIPESILTPDTVETRVGTLEFFDGIPNDKAAAALFDNTDESLGCVVFAIYLPHILFS